MKKQRRKRSKVWEIPHEEIQLALNTFNTYTKILEHFELNAYSGVRTTFMSRMKSEEYDLTKFKKNHSEYRKQYSTVGQFSKDNVLELEAILTINSDYSRRRIKTRLIDENLLENQCSICSLSNIWNNKPLSLQLDHINGIRDDNRLENLRLLCPNCHTQTPTFGTRNLKVSHKCVDCGAKLCKKFTRCKKCSSIQNGLNARKFEISKEELINLVRQYPMTKVGQILGVSDNAVRKRCLKLGIDHKNL